MPEPGPFGAILLAAGESSRLGRPKQLLPHEDKTLLQHAVDAAVGSGAAAVAVVLGASFESLQAVIREAPVRIVANGDWQKGLGTSVRAGLNVLLQELPDLAGVWMLLCDQPYVTGRLLQDLRDLAVESGKSLAACAYSDTLGVPLFVSRAHFEALLRLPDAGGAKVLLAAHPESVAVLPFPAGAVDIDTEADWQRFESASPESENGRR